MTQHSMRHLAWRLSLCLLPCAAVAGSQNNNKAAVALFQSRYDGITRAYIHKNPSALAMFLAPDYSAGDYAHPYSKQATLDALKNRSGGFQLKSMTVIAANVNGNKAATIVGTVTEGKITDKAGSHYYVIKVRNLDTWVHNPTGWQLKNSRVTQKSATKDGKALQTNSFGG